MTNHSTPTDPIAQFFDVDHLPPDHEERRMPFTQLARWILTLPRNPERTVALRKLLECKDAAVRAARATMTEPPADPRPRAA